MRLSSAFFTLGLSKLMLLLETGGAGGRGPPLGELAGGSGGRA